MWFGFLKMIGVLYRSRVVFFGDSGNSRKDLGCRGKRANVRSRPPQSGREQERAEEDVLRKGMVGSAGQAAVNSACASRVLEKCDKSSDTGHPHTNLSHTVRHVGITYTVPVSLIPLG